MLPRLCVQAAMEAALLLTGCRLLPLFPVFVVVLIPLGGNGATLLSGWPRALWRERREGPGVCLAFALPAAARGFSRRENAF